MAIMIPVTLFAAAPTAAQDLPRLLLIMVLVFCSGAYAASPDAQAEAGYMFDDNVARAQDGANKLGDRSYSVNLSQPVIFPVAEHERVLLTGSVGGEMFDRYKGLSRLTGSVHGEFQYRSSAEFDTPTFALHARITAEQYQSWLRDGFRYSAGVSMRQAVTDRIRFFGAVAHNERNSNSVVFDNKDNSARINLDYSLSANSTIYLGGEYRRGDLVISGSPVWSAYNYNAYTGDDAFSRGQIYIFRFDGTTALSALGYNQRVGLRDSIDFSWRRVRSSVSYVTPSWSNVTCSYLTNQYSAAYLKRF